MSSSRGTVLIVEDNHESAALLSDFVQAEGFHPAVATSASDALAAFDGLKPVTILLDWGLPDAPGLEVCRLIRARDGAVPILFVSGRDDEASIARGLDAGADDYIAKPVRRGELMARLEAHLRRAEAFRSSPNGEVPTGNRTRIHLGPIDVDLSAREVLKRGHPIQLGSLEFRLLDYLLRNAGTAVSREQILSEVYGYDAEINSDRVDVLVRRLRSKLGSETGRLIAAVPGYGYRIDRRETKTGQ